MLYIVGYICATTHFHQSPQVLFSFPHLDRLARQRQHRCWGLFHCLYILTAQISQTEQHRSARQKQHRCWGLFYCLYILTAQISKTEQHRSASQRQHRCLGVSSVAVHLNSTAQCGRQCSEQCLPQQRQTHHSITSTSTPPQGQEVGPVRTQRAARRHSALPINSPGPGVLCPGLLEGKTQTPHPTTHPTTNPARLVPNLVNGVYQQHKLCLTQVPFQSQSMQANHDIVCRLVIQSYYKALRSCSVTGQAL